MYKKTNDKKAARQENRQIKKAERPAIKAQKKMDRSTGLEFEQRVKKRDMKPLKKK
jgi:hypothetical protein